MAESNQKWQTDDDHKCGRHLILLFQFVIFDVRPPLSRCCLQQVQWPIIFTCRTSPSEKWKTKAVLLRCLRMRAMMREGLKGAVGSSNPLQIPLKLWRSPNSEGPFFLNHNRAFSRCFTLQGILFSVHWSRYYVVAVVFAIGIWHMSERIGKLWKQRWSKLCWDKNHKKRLSHRNICSVKQRCRGPSISDIAKAGGEITGEIFMNAIQRSPPHVAKISVFISEHSVLPGRQVNTEPIPKAGHKREQARTSESADWNSNNNSTRAESTRWLHGRGAGVTGWKGYSFSLPFQI